MTDLVLSRNPNIMTSLSRYDVWVFSKGGGGILLNSYKVVEIFVHIIYESTLGVYGKVLGISRTEKKKS